MGLSMRNTNSMMPFGETQSKATRAYAQSGQYHTIVESHVRLTSRCLPNSNYWLTLTDLPKFLLFFFIFFLS